MSAVRLKLRLNTNNVTADRWNNKCDIFYDEIAIVFYILHKTASPMALNPRWWAYSNMGRGEGKCVEE